MNVTLKTLADKAGGIKALARSLSVKHQSLYSWRRIPAERVLEVERITGIPRHDLRPDLYPRPSQDGEAA